MPEPHLLLKLIKSTSKYMYTYSKYVYTYSFLLTQDTQAVPSAPHFWHPIRLEKIVLI
jgi:hypothetical protein